MIENKLVNKWNEWLKVAKLTEYAIYENTNSGIKDCLKKFELPDILELAFNSEHYSLDDEFITYNPDSDSLESFSSDSLKSLYDYKDFVDYIGGIL